MQSKEGMNQKMQTNKRYIVYDKYGCVELAGDFDGLKEHFDNIAENTL